MQGKDFTLVLDKTQDMSQWRDAVFMEDLFLVDMFRQRGKSEEVVLKVNKNLIDENKSYRSHGVRTDRYKYFVYYEHNPKIEELYDVDNDPFEQHNLVNSAEYTFILKKLRKQTEYLYQKAIQ